MAEMLERDGKKYLRTEDGKLYRLRRVYECAGCDRIAEAGSEELLKSWVLEGMRWADGRSDVIYYCADCARERV